MSESTIWWLLAGAAVALELMTGTFYLLMIAVGLIAGAVAAHLGLAMIGQMVIAAAIGGGAVAAWRWRRSKSPAPLPANANRDVHLDIGEPVHVARWNADGTATVKFRGANWTAVAANPAEPAGPGSFRIKEMLGNRLVIEKLWASEAHVPESPGPVT
jgi:membrane protein implicated in regulation of membrane protease activity